jgi:predicted AAA+ superfamily ATPase
LKNLFVEDFDIKRIIAALQIETSLIFNESSTLIVFDEIQEAPKAISSLKYFFENFPQYHIISAGSLLGISVRNNDSFPVGKVDFLDLYPLDFKEFILASGEQGLESILNGRDWKLISTFKQKLISLLRQYYFTGGMPEAVLSYTQDHDFDEVRRIQERILTGYEYDFSKHAPNSIVPKIRMLWNSIPSQLSKENKKFIYGIIKEGSRAKDYENALLWLIDCGLVHKVSRVSKSALPLKAYEDISSFKLFIVDIGLLCAMANLDKKTILDGNVVFEEFKGSITEQFVLQQLIREKAFSVFYWSLEKSAAEVDFLVQLENKIIPIEVKAEENLRSKSLKVYFEKYQPETVIRTSLSDYREESWLINIPIYAINDLALSVRTK